MSQREHLIFFDTTCPLCQGAVAFVLSQDHKKSFLFASLDGKTAERELVELRFTRPKVDSLILLQDYGDQKERVLIEGQAVLRILWLLGGFWALFGILSFLPPFGFNFFYRFVAKNRHRLFKSLKSLSIDSFEGRFLD